MKTYTVHVYVTVEIKANSAEEAEQKASNRYEGKEKRIYVYGVDNVDCIKELNSEEAN